MPHFRKWTSLPAIIVALLSLAAVMLFPGTCGSPYDARLQHIDSLMDRNPQAAYDSLSLFDSLHLYDDDKASRMRLLMLKAKAQNKLYLPMPSDTIFNEVVSYYDRHGSANDRMLSRYLFGCIYRDMDNGPKAVRCYLEAIELAATTGNDCDYSMLSKIEGQLATVYNTNGMYREALEAGGLSTTGHPVSACDYDTFLPKIGFHSVDKNNYSPQKGDIIVLEAVEGHPNGHIAMYSGSKWISDFVQSDMWGGSAFRNKAEYTLFRR